MRKRTSDVCSSRRKLRRERGFVLIAVLWGLGLLSLLVMMFVLNTRTHTKITSNLTDQARIEEIANAGVNLAILDVVNASRQRDASMRFKRNGQALTCNMGRKDYLIISVQDEESKIDLNGAGVPLLRLLMTGLGVSDEDASRYADAIIDFRDTDSLRRVNGAERGEYQAANKRSGPKNYAFQDVRELHQVLNLPQVLVDRMLKVTTVYSRRGGIDPQFAPADLLTALAKDGALSPLYTIRSNRRTFMLRAEAISSNGATYVREAIVRLKPSAPRGYQILSWRRGTGSALKPVRKTFNARENC